MRIADRAALAPEALEVAEALELLRRLHVGRNTRPIAETLTMLLQAVRAQADIALWQNGEQALANCQRLIDTARRFERTASSFRAFVESIETDAERGEVDEAPIVEEGTEGVRVMTVFKAKGLEFPVVILGDPTCPASRDRPGRHIDISRSLWLEPICGASPIELLEASDLELKRDRAEAVRVAYVAATRARDLLVMPTCGDEPDKRLVRSRQSGAVSHRCRAPGVFPCARVPRFRRGKRHRPRTKGETAVVGVGQARLTYLAARGCVGHLVGPVHPTTENRRAGTASASETPRTRSRRSRRERERSEP